ASGRASRPRPAQEAPRLVLERPPARRAPARGTLRRALGGRRRGPVLGPLAGLRRMKWTRETGGFDEAFEAAGRARPHYRPVPPQLQEFSAREIERRERLQRLSLLNQGITFTVYGEKEGIERIFPFDFVPRIIPAAEWRGLEAGLVQRITALNL